MSSIITIAAICVLAVICVFQYFFLKLGKLQRHSLGHDTLTGLRTMEHLSEHAQRFRTDNTPRYIIYTDIAEFKLINELFGRETGSHVLMELAYNLKRLSYSGCLCGRIYGDHFVVIIRKSDFNESILDHIRQSMENTVGDSGYRVRIYFGVYETSDFSEPLASMCDKASIAVNSIKHSTQEFVAYYDEAMMRRALYKKRTIDEFDTAMDQSEFKMFLQPQFTAGNNELIGAEALVRRIRSDGHMVPPLDFIPVYEKTGLICRLDKFMWEQAAMRIADWQRRGIRGRISVNISPKDFYYIDVFEEFRTLVKKYSIPPELLNVEITETALMSDAPGLREAMRALRAYGFVVEIDDFGSGYSSLNALKDINADVLKIDMGFLRRTENNERGRIILDSVIRMGKKLNMTIITEGVETREQADMLTEMGCDYFQGYLFSKPISIEEFEDRYIGSNGLPQHGNDTAVKTA